MQTPIVGFELLPAESSQLSQTLADDFQIGAGLLQRGLVEWFIGGLSQCGEHQYLLTLGLQVLLEFGG